MTFRSVLSAVLAAAALVSAAHAQVAPAPRAGAVSLAGGFDPLDHSIGVQTGNLVLQGGYERRLGTSRFGLRLEGEYWRQRSRFTPYVADGATAALPVTRVLTLGGASLLGTYHFAPAGWLRPYVLGGVGLQQLSERSQSDPSHEGLVAVYRAHRANVAAYTGGLGLEAAFGRAALFMEGRVMLLPGTAGTMDNRTMPLTIGLRF